MTQANDISTAHGSTAAALRLRITALLAQGSLDEARELQAELEAIESDD